VFNHEGPPLVDELRFQSVGIHEIKSKPTFDNASKPSSERTMDREVVNGFWGALAK
jgi:hypothetical protein